MLRYQFGKVELFFFFSSYIAGQEMHQDFFENKKDTKQLFPE